MGNTKTVILPECIKTDGKNAVLKIGVCFSDAEPVKALVFVNDTKGYTFNCEAVFEKGANETVITCPNIRLWNPEAPKMYLLSVSVEFSDGKEEKLECPFGFRILKRDKKTVTLNGHEIKLLGIAYREHGPIEEVKKDLVKFKEAHINFLRSMYGTFSQELLMWCDENGIFTEDSLPFYGVGTTGPAEEDLPHLKEKFEDAAYALLKKGPFAGRIIISLGHDSSFGQNFRAAGEIIKKADKTSLLTFHLPMSIPEDDLKIDVWAMHYIDWRLPFDRCYDQMVIFHTPGAKNEIGYSAPYNEENIPVLHEIFAPVPNHNREELLYDPGVRDFWEKSVIVHTLKIRTTKDCLGGAILAGKDEDGTLPELEGYRWGILDKNHEPKREYYAVKRAYEPLKVRMLFKRGHFVNLLVEDHLQFTDIRDCIFRINGKDCVVTECEYGENGIEKITVISDLPVETLKICLPDKRTEVCALELADIKEADRKANAIIKVPESGYGKLSISEDEKVITISNNKINAVFCKECGKVKEISFDGKKVITNGPDLVAVNYTLYEWEKESVRAYYENDDAVIEITGTYKDSLKIKFIVKISENALITTEYEVLKLFRHMPHAVKSEIGISSGGLNEKGIAYTFVPGFEALLSGYRTMEGTTSYKEEKIETNKVYASIHEYTRSFLKAKDGSGVLFPGEPGGSLHLKEYPEYSSGAVIDDRDPEMEYEGKWYKVEDYCGNYKNTESMSREKGASVTVRFKGTGISLYGCYDMNNGKSDIYLDGEPVKENLDQYLPNVNLLGVSRGYEKAYRQCLYSVDGLKEGPHTLKLTVKGEKQKAANNCYASVDYAVIRGEEYESGLTVHENQEYNYSRLVRGSVRNNPVYLTEGEKKSAAFCLIPKGGELR